MIFVDTWAWIALASRRDHYHAAAVAEHERLVEAGRVYVTTDYVLSETVTQLYKFLAPTEAELFVTSILTNAEQGDYRLVHVTEGLFRRAWDPRRRYRDKPEISFVDLTSMVVMQDLGIADVFTGDAHFLKVGLGFRLFPDPTARTPGP